MASMDRLHILQERLDTDNVFCLLNEYAFGGRITICYEEAGFLSQP